MTLREGQDRTVAAEPGERAALAFGTLSPFSRISSAQQLQLLVVVGGDDGEGDADGDGHDGDGDNDDHHHDHHHDLHHHHDQEGEEDEEEGGTRLPNSIYKNSRSSASAAVTGNNNSLS